MAGILSLIPLIILFSVVGGLGWFGYQIYLYTHDLAHHGRQHMEKKNISFNKEGMKVGVKGKSAEDYEDSTQKAL
ncbi:hypothetical protein BT63DRAFT_199697 [Microthyrium microscopicum]|uniref:Uncharacterized protein n=1 Tax=Microthyrium microscopicum TaxID=703497 RepID=A0A6A6UGC9_9PEZI|nr:hypothetical protein BT63DRAFT_199697 [Microthyrium microscopicum]